MPTEIKLIDLKDADYNPRLISEEALKGLEFSLDTFGDISGIVYNRKTGNIVCGHQRKRALIAKYGNDLKVIVSEDSDEGYILTPTGEKFKVRFVDWDIEKERAANIVANTPTIQGQFTTDVQDLLQQIQIDTPDVFEETRLFDLMPTMESDIFVPSEETNANRRVPVLQYGDIVKFNEHVLMVSDLTRDSVSEFYQAVGQKAMLTFFNAPKWTKGKFDVEQSTDDLKTSIEEASKCLTAMTSHEKGRIVVSSETFVVSLKQRSRAGVKTIKTRRYMSPLWQEAMFALGFGLLHHRFHVYQSSFNVLSTDDKVGGDSKIVQTFVPLDKDIEFSDIDECRFETEVQTYMSVKNKERKTEEVVAYWRDQRVWEVQPVEFYKRLCLLYTEKRGIVFDVVTESPFSAMLAVTQTDRIYCAIVKSVELAEQLLLQYSQTVKDLQLTGITRQIDFSNLLKPISTAT